MQKLFCFIGRFQPWHNGHAHILAAAAAKLGRGDRILILCGSANVAPNPKNPWSFLQRETYIRQCLPKHLKQKVLILPVPDLCYNEEQWFKLINKKIQQAKELLAMQATTPVHWLGHTKDASCAFLSKVPAEKYYEVPMFSDVNATDLRYALSKNDFAYVAAKVPQPMLNWLQKFMQTNGFLLNNQLNSPEAKQTTVFCFVVLYKNRVMLLKDEQGLHLPYYEASQALANHGNIVSAWYPELNFSLEQEFEYYSLSRLNSGGQKVIATAVKVDYMQADVGLLWSDIYRLPEQICLHDHGSIAYNVLHYYQGSK